MRQQFMKNLYLLIYYKNSARHPKYSGIVDLQIAVWRLNNLLSLVPDQGFLLISNAFNLVNDFLI